MIYYSGIGCKTGEIHTEQEFLDIMKTHFIWKDWNKDCTWSAHQAFLLYLIGPLYNKNRLIIKPYAKLK